jgi:hypothetical protein
LKAGRDKSASREVLNHFRPHRGDSQRRERHQPLRTRRFTKEISGFPGFACFVLDDFLFRDSAVSFHRALLS